MTRKEIQLVEALYSIGAFRFGRFKYAAGQIAPLYCNLKVIRSHREVLMMAAQLLTEKINGLGFLVDPGQSILVADVPSGSTPLTVAVMLISNYPMISPSRKKEHGSGDVIDGTYKYRDLVIIIEDVISGAKSSREVARKLTAEGLIVKDIVGVIDGGLDGRHNIEQMGMELTTILNLQEVMAYLHEKGRITPEIYAEIEEYFADPDAYSQKVGEEFEAAQSMRER